MDTFPRRSALRAAAGTAGLAAATAGLSATGGVASAAQRSARQRAFAAAAAEFGVPERVLLAVSYLESRWDDHGGRPSSGAGYGPMHLTDLRTAAAGGSHHDHRAGTATGGDVAVSGTVVEDPRGDTARRALRPVSPAEGTPTERLQTIDLASELTGVDKETLRTDPVENIRGGAALLAHYQRTSGTRGHDPGDFYGAVARYAGADDEATAGFFADEVYTVLAEGAERVTVDGETVRLAATSARPDRTQLRSLGLRTARAAPPEGPDDLPVEWIPAPYERLSDDPGSYGNHDRASRPDSQRITHIVIHDTECSYDVALGLVQDPEYVSWHYTIRSSDGHVAQHVRTEDVGWHAGNWYVNAKSVGIEHEGFAAEPAWYTEAMYRASAKLVRHLARRFRIPLDRHHIIGHDNVPGTIPENVAGMHWDPGPYWDWAHYFELLGAELPTWRADTGLVVVLPDFDANHVPYRGCEADDPSAACPVTGSAMVLLRTEPRDDAPLLSDPALNPDGSPQSMQLSDWGSRVVTGQVYAVADSDGDWTAIWFNGRKAWLKNPASAPVVRPTLGVVAAPKAGSGRIPVYGRAYPEAGAYPEGVPPQELAPLQYSIPEGQRYAVGLVVDSEYYHAKTYDESQHVVVRGEKYAQVQLGHRVAYVRLADVDTWHV
ncbi:N-acetylmuramoyl-L-alanine amidase [Prauserella aidingensis]|uniref:N-acetylmuramoyl-L-alanine amidase n=1 Tax=Prauserella aidingensis TaxID=387890 RepID=UPI0020A2E2CA|nr:peptidoglycan recognition family protein [Prauserella aidingensis]MCP2254744.1 N-acetylmuramoyl-L-alanine amidase [Prauserella aidingensis]